MAQPLEFQQKHLDGVSRSFAFCIRRLPQPLGRWVGLTYLICRILDTIEDAPWHDPNAQSATFAKFESGIRGSIACAQLAGWESGFPPISEAEKQLLQDAHLIVADLHELPESARASIQDLVLSMSSGMRHFVEKRNRSGLLRLSSLAEVNQYCFFVAGLVGEALTQLVATVEPRFPSTLANCLRAHHFGFFLQKVNILKDQHQDEEAGRLLIPSREQVENSARSDAREALEFLCAIPSEQVEFRQFCGWSLFLGLETLLSARASLLKQVFQKISRSKTQDLLKHVDEMICDNQRLRDFFLTQAKRLNWDFSSDDPKWPSLSGRSSPEWLGKLYRGQLDAGSLVQLGVTQ